MGREVKRVPLGFDWPQGKVWWGYLLDPVPCQTCGGRGVVAWQPEPLRRADGTVYWTRERRGGGGYHCPTCEGDGKAYPPSIELPVGDGWQMWETTSEGLPISPVFETPEELARWLADTGASAFGDATATYDAWLATIRRGFACSAVATLSAGLVSGVTGLHEMEREP